MILLKQENFVNEDYFTICHRLLTDFHNNVLSSPLFPLQKLKHRARGCSPDIRQIDLDVNRTFRDHIMFRDRYGVK